MKNMNITGAAEITLKTLHGDRHVKAQEESPGKDMPVSRRAGRGKRSTQEEAR